MQVKKWMLLPFGAAGEAQTEVRDKIHHVPHRRNQQPIGENGLINKHESAADFAAKDEHEIIHDYNAPIRWWVQATLFPLIAGTFGPMASAFNICAVAIEWRLIVDPGMDQAEGQKIGDPRWLVAVNVVSLVIALIANLALLGHMTGRIPFNISAPMVIVGWYLSGFILVGLVGAAQTYVPLPDNPMAAYSQAYYYACFAAGIYILLSVMLSFTAYGIFIGHYGSQFKLSLSQRSLMLQTMLFLGYILAAGEVFSYIEGWLYLDGVYYIVITLFTIGFGDFTPESHLGRSLYFPMSVGGIVFVGLIIANIRSLVIESASVKVSTRLVEKARFKAMSKGDPANGTVKIRGFMKRDMTADTELERREKEFNIMREIQTTAARNNKFVVLFMAIVAFMLLWFIGAVAFWKAEQGTGGQNWSYFEALYFAYTAQLTIGYGDFEPQTNAAKPTFVFWSLIALPTLTVLIGAVGDAVAEAVRWGTEWTGKHVPALANFLINALKGEFNPKKAIRQTLHKAENAEENDQDGFEGIASVEGGKVLPIGISADTFELVDLDKVEQAYLPFIIMQAAQKVLSHMDNDTPRKYSFEEWTWLLRLLGEDEATEEGHRIVGRQVPAGHDVSPPLRSSGKQHWSWMGQESPLMDLEDGSEPKWVLRRLMEALEKDLKKRADLKVEKVKEKDADVEPQEAGRA